MQIFDTNKSDYDHSINFVDINNVLIGYSLDQSCCEHAGWYISENKEMHTKDMDIPEDQAYLAPYIFDTSSIEEFQDPDNEEIRFARVRLTAENKTDLYLHLFNSHNGYYSHGFVIKHGENILEKGSL